MYQGLDLPSLSVTSEIFQFFMLYTHTDTQQRRWWFREVCYEGLKDLNIYI
jgi:hypothetical protein